MSVFFISFCIAALARRNKKQHTQQQQQQYFIHTIQVPGEVEKRKKLQKRNDGECSSAVSRVDSQINDV